MRTFEFAGPAGRLEALLDEPVEAPRTAVVLAHPHPTVGATSDRVTLLFGIASPVEYHAFDALRRSTKPKFFVHGERDELCTLSAMRQLYAELLEPKELVVIDAADHLFDGKTQEVGDAIEDLLSDWKGSP